MITGRDFTIVIITRNRPSILAQCLESLSKSTQQPGQIIVVDSSEKFQPLVASGVQHVAFPSGRSQMPLARNEGTRLARTKIVAFIDDDCLVDNDWLECLRRAYIDNPEIAGVGGRITDHRWKFVPDLPIGKVDSKGRVTSNFFGDGGGRLVADILPGGNMSFKREWLTKVGGFDPGYVATNHREDPDLCLRIKNLGGKLIYEPTAHAFHLNARTMLGELKPWHEFYLRYSFARNESYFFARHFPKHWLQRWLSICTEQIGRARSGSLVATLCIVVQFCSFPLGLISYFFRNVLAKTPQSQ